jgi:O-antigen/teichoic acid export membrane protein
VILGFAVTSTRRFDVQLPLQFVVAITSGLASLIAIPRFGLSGAALALGAAAFVQISGQLIILRKAL